MTLLDPSTITLGCRHRDGRTHFGLWAPNATAVTVITQTPDHDPVATKCDAGDDGDDGDDGTWYTSTNAQPGDHYHYVLTTPDGDIERTDPRARFMTNSVGRSIVADDYFDWTNDHFVAAPVNELVIYELHPKTFAGDLDDVADRLHDIADLGANAIELMPVAEFSGDRSWGYNPAQPFAIESSYGGPDAMKRLVDRAHQLGLAIIIDVVYNHFGPSDLDMWQFDGWSENEGGGIYFYNDWRAETAWGATRPDYGRDEVRQYLIDNALMWIDDYHVDGLRLDSTVNIRNARGEPGPDGDLEDGARLLRDLTDTIHALHPSIILIAEDLQKNPSITETTDDGGHGFDLQWSAGFVHQVRNVLETGADFVALTDALCGARPFSRVVYTESHDEVANGRTRVNASVDPDDPNSFAAFRRSAIGAVLTFTVPDVPMIFQGQEWGDDHWFDDERDLDWTQRDANAGTVALWRDLMSLRTGRDGRAPGLRGDQIRILDTGDPGIVAYLRWGIGGEDAAHLVAVNLNDHEVIASVDVEAGWRCVLDTTSPDYHNTGATFTPSVDGGGDDSHIALGAHGAAIFVR